MLFRSASLKPEQSWNYGLDYSVKPAECLDLQVSVYQSKLSDVIQEVTNMASVYVWNSSKNAYVLSLASQLQNTGKATFSGIELAANWHPVKWLKTFSSYSYTDKKNDSNPALIFTDVPKNKLNGSVQFLRDKKTWVMIEGEYNAKRFSTSDGKYTAGGYGLINLRGSVAMNEAIAVQMSVENLFDRNYQVAEGYPEPGRTFVLSMGCAF